MHDKRSGKINTDVDSILPLTKEIFDAHTTQLCNGKSKLINANMFLLSNSFPLLSSIIQPPLARLRKMFSAEQSKNPFFSLCAALSNQMGNDGIFGNTSEDEGTSADDNDTKDKYRAPALAKLLMADIASTAGLVKLVFIRQI